ncbi:MAG: DUF1972 domain-containing protein [Bacteroidota bacterium]
MGKFIRIGIVGTVGLPACYGGFETLAQNLVKQLSNKYDLTVYCSGKKYPSKNRLTYFNGAKLRYLPLKANGVQSILYDLISMIHAMFTQDLILVLGVSGCAFIPVLKFFTRKKFLVNIDGLEWRRDKWRPWVQSFLKFSEAMAVKYADGVVADNQAIRDYVMEEYGVDAHLASYGGDQAQREPIELETISQYPFLKGRYFFKVCRIEPENNVEMILEGFARYPKYPFVLVGNWNHSEFGRKLKQTYEGYNHIYLYDPIYDPKTLGMLRSNAWVYIHGHSAGGTNPSLVEAMNLNLPILAYDVNYNRETTEGKGIYFGDAFQLFSKLQELNEPARQELGRKMGEIAKRRYTWKVISEQYDVMFGLYKIGNYEKETISLDNQPSLVEPVVMG